MVIFSRRLISKYILTDLEILYSVNKKIIKLKKMWKLNQIKLNDPRTEPTRRFLVKREQKTKREAQLNNAQVKFLLRKPKPHSEAESPCDLVDPVVLYLLALVVLVSPKQTVRRRFFSP